LLSGFSIFIIYYSDVACSLIYILVLGGLHYTLVFQNSHIYLKFGTSALLIFLDIDLNTLSKLYFAPRF